MSLGKQQTNKAKTGALVLVSSPVVEHKAGNPDQTEYDAGIKNGMTGIVTAARSVYLTQLSKQYETKSTACARRNDARACAKHSYERKSPKPAPRHLAWA